LEVFKDRADNVIVGKSGGGNHSFSADEAFKGHKMYEICRENGEGLVNLSKLPSMFVEDKIKGTKVKVLLPELLFDEIDCFISVPVLKVHVMNRAYFEHKEFVGLLSGYDKVHISQKGIVIEELVRGKSG
jgi:uncharacterized protein (DUF362 family)